MLNSKFRKIQLHFGISSPEDYCDVSPQMLRNLDGIGDATINYIRLMLANRGLTMLGDETPEYWKAHPVISKIGETLGFDDVQPVCPFKILIDSAEQQPFSFRGIFDDGFYTDIFGDKKRRELIVQTDGPRPGLSLGRHPDSLGDYSVDGFVGRVGVERKSMADLQSTILGWTRAGEEAGRRERFERELHNLAKIEAGLVVVECDFNDVILHAPEYGKKTKAENAKILCRSIFSYMQDYKTPWLFAGGRRMAEVATFRFLERFVRKHTTEEKKQQKLAAVM